MWGSRVCLPVRTHTAAQRRLPRRCAMPRGQGQGAARARGRFRAGTKRSGRGPPLVALERMGTVVVRRERAHMPPAGCCLDAPVCVEAAAQAVGAAEGARCRWKEWTGMEGLSAVTGDG